MTFQIFSRELGPPKDPTRETTAVVGAGIRVSKRHPVTFSAVVPYSWISEPGASRNGAEDALFSLRYRYDLKGLQERWDREGNSVMGMGAMEVNNGTIDHGRWSGQSRG